MPVDACRQAVLHDALTLRDRRDSGRLVPHGLATARGRLAARLACLLDTPPTLQSANRFANHLDTEWNALFTFLHDPSVEAAN